MLASARALTWDSLYENETLQFLKLPFDLQLPAVEDRKLWIDRFLVEEDELPEPELRHPAFRLDHTSSEGFKLLLYGPYL